MRLISLALALAPLTLAACSPAEGPASAAETPSAPYVAAPPAETAPPANDPALDNAVAMAIGEAAEGTRTIVRSVGTGDQRIALVQLIGMNWCGSGGCSLLILRPAAGGYQTVGNIGRVSNPVRVLTTTTNGLPDIGVTVSGGGGPAAYEAKLSFDGEAYPDFPSDTPLVGAEGTVVMTDADMPPPAD